jgi:hypothetical protein
MMLHGITMFGKIISSLESSHLNAAAGKGLPCPGCGVVRMDLAGDPKRLITCTDCGHVAAASDWLASQRSGKVYGRADQPPVNTAITKHQSGNLTIWEIPPSGRSGGMLLFGWIWTGFSLLIAGGGSCAALFAGEGASLSAKLIPIGMLVLFQSIGIGMLYAAYRSKNAKHQVTVGGGVMTLRREWRGKVREVSLPTSERIIVDQVVFYSSNDNPVYGIEVRGGSDKFRFGSTLTPEEKGWLVAEFKIAIGSHADTRNMGQTGGRKDVFSLVVPKSGSLFPIGALFLLMGIGAAVLGWKIVPGKGGWAVNSQTILWAFSGMMFLVGAVFTGIAFSRSGFETRLDGSHGQLAIRKMKKGLPVSENLYDRSTYRDIRTKDIGHNNGRRMKSIELLIGSKSERLASWVDAHQADDFAAAVREAMGGAQ